MSSRECNYCTVKRLQLKYPNMQVVRKSLPSIPDRDAIIWDTFYDGEAVEENFVISIPHGSDQKCGCDE